MDTNGRGVLNRRWALGLAGRTAAVTGGGGAICGAIAEALAAEGVGVAVWDLSEAAARKEAEKIVGMGGNALAVACDVLDRAQVADATRRTAAHFGGLDILVNGAGGSRKEATTSPELSFFDIPESALMDTLGLNYTSAVLPSQAAGRVFADRARGVILNIASVAGMRPLSRAVGYSNGKAALISFTQWLAVHMAREYSPEIRVNALAPGFVLTAQNRFLLVDEKTGAPTERGRAIVARVPMGRYAGPEEIAGAAVWLVSDAARFVTGAVVPVDGGFTAESGV
jgi:NAD(P)-dependent dehydrogenase (short-subunit alcohol dehydrogenase family)